MNEIENRWLTILENELSIEMTKAPSIVSSNNIQHIRRVWEHAKRIAKDMDIDWEVLIAAVYLHDIGRHYPEGINEHGPISAPFAKQVLERIDFPKEKRENVILSIKYHDEFFPSAKRETIESKILYDADKLDVFGAIGVCRFLTLHTSRGKTPIEIADFALKNLPLRFERLELEQTKISAKNQYNYALDYFKKLRDELS